VTVIYPDDMNVTNVQELAEKAWRSVNKEITIGKVTVKVRAFGREIGDIERSRRRAYPPTQVFLSLKWRQARKSPASRGQLPGRGLSAFAACEQTRSYAYSPSQNIGPSGMPCPNSQHGNLERHNQASRPPV
jgi:hypothetical protein